MSVQTTIGSFRHAYGWSAVVVLELDGEQLLIEERHARPDDPDSRGLVLRRYRADEREQPLADGTARVLALGGRLDCEPEQLADSPGRGTGPRRAAARAAQRRLARARRTRPRPVAPEQARRMFGTELDRYLHLAGAAPRQSATSS